MAKAPIPGSVRKEAEKAGVPVFEITVHRPVKVRGRELPKTVEVAPDLVPMRERRIFRREAEYPVEKALDPGQFGIDTIMNLWWLGHRIAGDVTLTLRQVEEAWPVPLADDEWDLEITIVDDPDETEPDTTDEDEDDSPEG